MEFNRVYRILKSLCPAKYPHERHVQHGVHSRVAAGDRLRHGHQPVVVKPDEL